MNRRQELCRNFQRGSCKYGAQCRYLHASSHQQQQQQHAKPNPFGFGAASRQQPQQQQQQAKPNPFGFGAASRQQQQQQSFGSQYQQQQQQKPNPYGFGVQGGAAQSQNAPGPAKPFQNKWVRDSSAPTKQGEAQPAQQAAHTSCTDPESCRQQIADDFKNEAPLWKLTCYAHLRSGPCDITGDISYEELRVKAYEQGKQGHSLQSIVEGERNLQNAKLAEFSNLLNKTRPSQTPSFSNTGSFPEVKNSPSFGVSQATGPPGFASFNQFGAATNVGPGSRSNTPVVPTNTLFGKPTQPSPAPFGAPTFGAADMKFGVQAFGNQASKQPFGNFQGSSMSSSNSFQKSPASVQHRDIDRQSLELLNGMTAPTSTMDQAIENSKIENQDDSIWLKEKWTIGEIPLNEPPQRHISHVF